MPLSDEANLRFGDTAGAAQGLQQGITFLVEILPLLGLHHHGVESRFDPAVWLQPVGKEAAASVTPTEKPCGYGMARLMTPTWVVSARWR